MIPKLIKTSGVRLSVALICVALPFSLWNCMEAVRPNISLDFRGNGPVLFQPLYISTSLYERDMAISPLGDELIYTLGNHRQTIRSLVAIKKNGNRWGPKEILPFSGRYNDIEPFFSPDGKSLYFASNRPINNDSTRADYNIWKVERTPDGWGEPVALDTIINTPGEEYYPSLSNNGNLYFTATRTDGIGREDIYVSQFINNQFTEPKVLDSNINSVGFEFNAYIHPEEDLLIFSSFGRSDGFGGGDLYYSLKNEEGKWSPAVNMGEMINSAGLDFCPFIDISRGVFYFTSDRKPELDRRLNSVEELEEEADRVLNGMGNIYRIKLEDVGIEAVTVDGGRKGRMKNGE